MLWMRRRRPRLPAASLAGRSGAKGYGVGSSLLAGGGGVEAEFAWTRGTRGESAMKGMGKSPFVMSSVFVSEETHRLFIAEKRAAVKKQAGLAIR